MPLAGALDPHRAMSQYLHDNWAADRGFLGGTIYAITQSQDGFLWIGTERGLVRFDGISFTLLQRPVAGSPAIGPVRGLVSDSEGNMWVRLDGPHLLRYQAGQFDDQFSAIGLYDPVLTAMARDRNGELLISGLSTRIFRYHDHKFEAVAKSGEIYGTVISIAESGDHTTWVGTRNAGLFRITDGHISDQSRGLRNRSVNTVLPSRGGTVWVGTDAGIEYWQQAGVTSTASSLTGRMQIRAMVEDREGNIWVGTDHGLLRNAAGNGVALDSINQTGSDDVAAIYEDRDGDVWYGGSHGLQRLHDGKFKTYSTAQGLPSESIGAIYVDAGDRTWFAPLSGGLYWMKDGQVSRITVGGLDRDVIYSISGGAENAAGGSDVWVGRQRGGLTLLTMSGGAYAIRSYTQEQGLPQNSVYSVCRAHDGAVWAGTVSGGVSRLSNGTITRFTEGDGLPSNTANAIVEASDDTIWVATPNGLTSYQNGHWTNHSDRDGLPSPNVKSIFEDSRHVLWIVTSSGLAYRRNGQIHTPPKLPEALREQIFGIAEDALGSLWLTTSDHVLQVNGERLLDGTLTDSDVQHYGISDGLQGVEGVGRDRTVVADRKGRIWVALDRGLSVADPSLTANSSAPVMVRIDSISADGESVSPQGSRELPARVQSIVINYAGTNLASPGRTQFRYTLDGSDRGWSDASSSRQVVYRNLGPASYRFRIVASNADGQWNGPETVVPFTIQPAFWQTLWFRLLCLAACSLAIVAVYRVRMFQLTGQLNLRFQERLAERSRIAQELHDTLLQGVLSASLQLDLAEDQLPDDSPAKPRLKRILQLMQRVTEEGRDALRGLRAAEKDNSSLDLAFSRMRQEFALDESIGYRVIVNSVVRPLRPMIRDEVYRIGREALVNAFVHAQARSIEVEVEYSSRHLRLLVRDDGVGIDAQVLHAGREGHWGLTGMRERSEGIGAKLRLWSRLGSGTEIELTVPGAIAYENEPKSNWTGWLSPLREDKFKPQSQDQSK